MNRSRLLTVLVVAPLFGGCALILGGEEGILDPLVTTNPATDDGGGVVPNEASTSPTDASVDASDKGDTGDAMNASDGRLPTWSGSPSGTSYNLHGVWGTGPSDVWAVGVAGTILHWTGSAWSGSPSGTTSSLLAVWGSGPTDVWAVGDTILHWNGTAWSPSPSVGATLRGVWGSGSNDVWAVGNSGKIFRWSGSSWVTVTSGTTKNLYRVWGSGPNDVWAVGDAGGIIHWNGSNWAGVASSTGSYLFDVKGSRASDVWAVGESIVHWNGAAWSSFPNGGVSVRAVWASGPSDGWAVGLGGALRRWTATTWTAASSGTIQNLSDVWGTSPSDVWIVGEAGTILHYN